jgi:RLL motif-containing protein 1
LASSSAGAGAGGESSALVAGGKAASEASPEAPALVALGSDDTRIVAEGVSKLCSALGVSEARVGVTQTELLDQCISRIRHSVLPAVRAARADGGTTTPLAGGLSLSDLRGLSSGVASGNERLDAAVQVLRLLYLDALRGAQDTANGILEAVQAFTADPRTDVRLGKVGR